MKTWDETKKKAKVLISCLVVSLFLTVFFVSSPAFCMERLGKKELKAETGQAGIDIGIDDMVLYHDRDSLKIMNPEKPDTNYVALENIKGIGTFATGYLDLDNDGKAGALSIDMGTVTHDTLTTDDDIPLVFITCPDWGQNINMMIGSINWCGKSIGSLDIKNFSLPSWHAYLGTYNGSGIRVQLGFRTMIEEVSFNYGGSGQSFSVKKLQAAGTYDHDPADTVQDNPSDPSTWKASGEFKIGDALADSPNPASIDVGVREIDGKTAIHLGLSASGSIRAADIKFGTQSFGPMAVDGINIHSMKIELPGRGLGDINP